MLTRRCSQRQYLLRPCKEVNEFFLFCLALAAKRSGVAVHGYCVMANHYHLVVTDIEGALPVFMHLLNMFVGRGLNAYHGRWESFWAPGSYSAVKLVEEEDVLGKLVYTLKNPVAAGLVESSRQWPGLCSQPEDMLGKRVHVARPKHFFRKGGRIPATLELTLSPPPVPNCERFVECTATALEQAEEEHRAAVRASGERFKGAKAATALHPFDAPTTPEERRRLNPRIACRNTDRRVEELRQLRDFDERYREAWARYQDGERKVPFPEGTYWMVVVAKQPSEVTA